MKTTVIVVDDDEAVRHSLEWLLKSWGYHVLSYDSATNYLRDNVRSDCEIFGGLRLRHTDDVVT